jgi:hypothetical protein
MAPCAEAAAASGAAAAGAVWPMAGAAISATASADTEPHERKIDPRIASSPARSSNQGCVSYGLRLATIDCKQKMQSFVLIVFV